MRGPELEDVTVVSVCYKSDAVIADMIDSIPKQTSIILVDNGGTNNFTSMPPDRQVNIVHLAENLGFGRGCNAGAAKAETSWLLFLNPDAILGEHALEALLKAAKDYPSAAAFNPRIANPDGSAYFKRRSYLLPLSKNMKRGWPDRDCEVPILSGAAIFVSKRVFDEVGGFDPNIFLYHEDDDISLRLRRSGPLMFVHGALAVHACGSSSGRSPEIAYFKAYHMARSRIYAGRKHGRPFPKSLTVIKALWYMLSPVNIFSKRRRAKSEGFLAGSISKS